MKKLIPIILLSIFFVFSYGAKKEIEKYPNGNMKSEVKLNKDGLKHGKYKSYYPHGKIQIKGKYKNGKKDGKWTFYEDDGGKIGEGNYKYGTILSGTFFDFYENGKIKEKGNYKDNIRDGIWISYYKNGKKKELRNYNGYMRWNRTSYYENGKIKEKGNYKDNIRNGIWISYYKNGKKKVEEEYKNGENSGWCTMYDEDGNITTEGIYENGGKYGGTFPDFPELEYRRGKVWNGLYTYYDDEYKWAGNIKDGKKHGKWTWYDENGQIIKELNFKDGKNHGICTFYDDGIIWLKGKDINGDWGKYTWYDENGKVEKECEGDFSACSRWDPSSTKTQNTYNKQTACQDPYGNWHNYMSTCATCGTSYCIEYLPYDKYCSQACCAMYEGRLSKCGY